MRVLVAGANGQIGKQIVAMLGQSKEHQAVAMIRKAEQADELEKLGAEKLIADLEEDIGHTTKGCDAVIFTAGSGGHTGADKTLLIDLDGAFKIIDAAEDEKVKRFIMVSAFHADDPAKGSDKMRHYNVAKQRADERLQKSGLNYTIVQPGKLTNEPGTGKIMAGESLEGKFKIREIPREDVARTVVAALNLDNLQRRTFKILSGDLPVADALKSL